MQKVRWYTHGLSLKQKKFADEYIISGNAEQSAIKAGYSEKYARGNAHKLVANSGIKTYIDERLAEIDSKKIADQKEIMEYWTSVMRGESRSMVIVIEGLGEGISRASEIEKKPDEKERLQASRELAKRIIDVQLRETKEDKLDRLIGSIESGVKDDKFKEIR